MTLPVTIEPTAYTVSALPAGHDRFHDFTITVERRSQGQWAVVRWGSCLSSDGTWDHEPLPSNRTDDWLARHRFDLETALRRAAGCLADIRVNDRSAADVQ